jgi:antitoxin component YwqK of YwqJK toxin-antitoxin module
MGNEITIGGIIVAAGIFLGLYADGGVVCSDIREHLDPQYRSRTIEPKRDEEPSSERQRSRISRVADKIESIEEKVINPPQQESNPLPDPENIFDRVDPWAYPELETRIEEGDNFLEDTCRNFSHLSRIILISRYDNGQEKFRIRCNRGKLCGSQLSWHENGQERWQKGYPDNESLDRVRDILDDKQLARFSKDRQLEWYENGQLAVKRTFFNGLPVGKQFGWHANGEKAWEENYDDYGKLEGQQVKWYDNKQLEETIHYINGIKEGLSVGWYKEGQKRFELNYVKGKKEGKQLKWYKSGQFYSREEFQNGREVSNQTRWYANGFKSDEVTYNYDSMRERTCKWDESGRVTEAETCSYWHTTIMDVTSLHSSCKYDLDACGNQSEITPRMEVNEQDRLLDEQTRLPASVEPINLEE